jgi:hypothetical protein
MWQQLAQVLSTLAGGFGLPGTLAAALLIAAVLAAPVGQRFSRRSGLRILFLLCALLSGILLTLSALRSDEAVWSMVVELTRAAGRQTIQEKIEGLEERTKLQYDVKDSKKVLEMQAERLLQLGSENSALRMRLGQTGTNQNDGLEAELKRQQDRAIMAEANRTDAETVVVNEVVRWDVLSRL